MLWRTVGPMIGSVMLVLATCWFMSLQHELIHGHPTQLDTCRTQFAGNLLPDWAVLLCNVLRVPLPSAVDVVFV